MSLSRRHFLRLAAATSGAFSGLPFIAHAQDSGDGPADAPYLNQVQGYGDLTNDPDGLFDFPEGFTYQVLSTVGDEMTDGLLAPGRFDGMGCFQRADGKLVLIRNHEQAPNSFDGSPFGPGHERLDQIDQSRIHDWAADGYPHLGGTSHLVVDPQTLAVEEQYMSLLGTFANCAGGMTPWGSWITCEEAAYPAGEYARKDHGYCFEIPVDATGPVEPVPLTAMGRFAHEAVAVDPVSGCIYLTEDRRELALFYRFIPNVRDRLTEGGRLQALAVRERPGLDLRNHDPEAQQQAPGTWFEIEWIDLDDVESPNGDLAERGHAAGAARLTRGEGMWFGDGECYFASTDGGPQELGQIWRYVPSPFEGTDREREQPGRLQLFVQNDNPAIMEKCDNLCVAPWGDLIVVEDGDAEQYIRGVTPEGQVYTIGRNAASGPDGEKSEITGPCFSPDGSTLFFNVQQHPGRTFAVRGPWHARSL